MTFWLTGFGSVSVSLFDGISTFADYLMPKQTFWKNYSAFFFILFWFKGASTIVGYLMRNPFLYILNVISKDFEDNISKWDWAKWFLLFLSNTNNYIYCYCC